LTETNLNWGNSSVTQQVQAILRKTWTNHSLTHSDLSKGFTSWNQPGGTATI